MAAIRDNRCTHREMSVTGRRGGCGRPGAGEPKSSLVTSDISTNSRLSMRFTILVGRHTTAEYGPGAFSSSGRGLGVGAGVSGGLLPWLAAASANRVTLSMCRFVP